MGAEIELKIPVGDAIRFGMQMAELGFRLDTPRSFERNTLYDTGDRSLRARGQILRLREYEGRWVLTHKRHPDQEELGSRYKTRIETETLVADGAAVAEVFHQLGYEPAFRYEKYRTEWSDRAEAGAHVVLDETPIGDYAELEGPPEWIDRTLAALGVDVGTALTESYGKLFLAWKRRVGSAAENLTFAEVLQAVQV